MQSARNFFYNSPLFSPKSKLGVHIVQLVLIVSAVVLTFVRMTMNVPRTRANTMALSMGAKSLIVIAYELLTEHVARFRKWKSLKAYAILNCLEVVFWAAVMFMVFRANMNSCTGISCALSWVVVILAAILHMLAFQTAVVAICEFRYFRRNGVTRDEEKESESEMERV
ncbi:hypothetical protein B0J12DRAFT_764679 [Macrophomina phaseolina]|uniref:Cytochrome P450 n=1 Tax=Macrophomina phaseolina TaxID=35725 RepID=A0ABQ8G2N9_9PEZI|nr:hypothetical protein B0J12DRAFT_764679 [Macrophomina phaseolina]